MKLSLSTAVAFLLLIVAMCSVEGINHNPAIRGSANEESLFDENQDRDLKSSKKYSSKYSKKSSKKSSDKSSKKYSKKYSDKYSKKSYKSKSYKSYSDKSYSKKAKKWKWW